ncbi:hypothetical protein PR202_ga22165 [Eleusine coracana subsp. coracana]|uniref:Uncharacterized protein n=1 Tax=Eleusine coracana subsp. coracana TaxID=191504 RepID=A0AAV5D2T0_ELECO|nr:hypothetical protein PR202_ga22165 [Eleusine coracana subsp. coracana]
MEQLTNLVVLDLSDNNITGPVPAFIRSMAGLVVLDLSSNKMEGPIPKFIRQFTSLRTLDLSNNHLNGSVPYEIGMLTNMISLFLNNNHLDGVIDEGHFANVRSLYYIDLSYNSFKIELSSEWRPPFRLCMAHFASCQMGPLFPAWLQWQVDIIEIVISSAGIIDKFPHWFCSSLPNLLYLNMSDNQLYGDLPLHMGNMSLDEVYLSSNLLTGQVPPLPITLTHLDISKNSLSGPLPSNFGSPKLAELSLFSNRITGGIPRSLICQCEELEILDLANNYFEGELPSCAGIRAIKNIELSHNSFFGEFPSFLENCTALQFLDLAGNKFFGRLPPWIGNLVRLQFLRLSHNMFSGNIPTNLTNLACLKYLDVAGNGISGLLPRHIWNLKSMRQKHWEANPLTCIYSEPIEYHSVSLYATTKGQQRDYGSSGRIMDLNTIYFDLSSNYLTGELPEELASLDLLRNLNLSRNNFTGNIANSVGAMQFLESLDLSRNDLSGEIPESLSNMTFLSYLDMSYNNLTGRIPSGSQLDTLYAAYPSMYAGNIGLCGPPLKNNCTSTDASKQDHYTRTEQGHGPEFFYLGLICGIIAGILVVYCSLLLK